MNIKELPTIERPCEKFSFYGAKKLSDSELLAIIIKTGTKDKTAVMLAQELMNKYEEWEQELDEREAALDALEKQN